MPWNEAETEIERELSTDTPYGLMLEPSTLDSVPTGCGGLHPLTQISQISIPIGGMR